MKAFFWIVPIITLLSGSALSVGADTFDIRAHGISYVSPVPGARYISTETSLIVRFDAPLGAGSAIRPGLFTVTGARSGRHPGTATLSDDNQTVIFKPERKFQADEEVTVRISLDAGRGDGSAESEFSYSFLTAKRRPSPSRSSIELQGLPAPGDNNIGTGWPDEILHTDTIPPGFPSIQSTIYDTTSPGYLFLSNIKFEFPATITPYLMILANNGDPVFYREMSDYSFDFKLQPNGLLTYYDNAASIFYALDSTYAIVDSFRCGNGYSTDIHELQILGNGHALLMSYDWQLVDMSQVVVGGDTAAAVIGLIIQEIDTMKNVVFQWRSWDHFLITDAINVNLLDTLIDYVHGNAIDLDFDGDLLVSNRHMSEITKISRSTGDIVWRLGGKNNQFTFVGDTLEFSYQHAIRRLPNGNITLYDNGNGRTPKLSRALEYALDETTMTATLVWEYREIPDIYGSAMGYVQRLPNGNTLIGWGSAGTAVTEVRPDGSKVFELKFDPGVYSYRAYRFDWKPSVVSVPPDVPRVASLSQNYPNPFNGGTRLSFTLTRSSTVTLNIVDLLGREVRSIIRREKRGVGTHDVELNFRDLAAGVYLTRLTTDEFTEVRKMVYIP